MLLSNNQILHHRLNIIIKRAKFPLPFFLSNKTKRVVFTWKEQLLQEKTQFLTNFIKPRKLKNMGKHHRMINMKLLGCPFLPICKKWQSRLCLFFKGLACTHSANCGRAVCRAQSQGLFRASTSQSSYLLCPSLVLWLWAAFILGHPIFKFFLFPAENYADVFRAKRNTAPKHGGSLHAPGLHEHLTAGQEADSNSHRTSLSTQTAKQIRDLDWTAKRERATSPME